ncbi:serine hydrolase domain-containing protein [Gracilimonas sp. Q87]|uniref:serine hydrolase domain-containing protein n=1 Tax=Gracilimonas sp. Q87 TaxID=3384766 RepID=UPI003983FBE8
MKTAVVQNIFNIDFRLLSVTILSIAFIMLSKSVTAQNHRSQPIKFEASNVKELQQELDLLEQETKFWGVVLITDGDQILLEEAFGLADRDKDIASTPQTAFNLASVGKLFTATTILKLAQNGTVSLDEPIGKWIDGLPNNYGQKVTIRHLLQMKSGWGDYMSESAYQNNPKDFRTVSDYVKLIRSIKPKVEPDTKMIYSNINYELLGAIIEVASGLSYEEAVNKNIWEPVDMISTGCFIHEPADSRATPYTKNSNGELVPAYDRMAYRCSPAGGAYSTVEDLYRYQRAVIDGKLLDERHTALLMNQFEEDQKNATRFGFAGGIEGANTWLRTNLKTDNTIIVLSNLDPPAAEHVLIGLKEWIQVTHEKSK